MPDRLPLTNGRTWSRCEYARFLVRDAGLPTAEAAERAGLRLRTAARATGHKPQAHAVGALVTGTRPFLAPGTRDPYVRAAAQAVALEARIDARRAADYANSL